MCIRDRRGADETRYVHSGMAVDRVPPVPVQSHPHQPPTAPLSKATPFDIGKKYKSGDRLSYSTHPGISEAESGMSWDYSRFCLGTGATAPHPDARAFGPANTDPPSPGLSEAKMGQVRSFYRRLQVPAVRHSPGSLRFRPGLFHPHFTRTPVSYTHLTLPTNREV